LCYEPKKILSTVLTLTIIGNAVSALGTSLIYEEVRFGINTSAGTSNTDWVLSGFSTVNTRHGILQGDRIADADPAGGQLHADRRNRRSDNYK
jgi:hypothetical protein